MLLRIHARHCHSSRSGFQKEEKPGFSAIGLAAGCPRVVVFQCLNFSLPPQVRGLASCGNLQNGGTLWEAGEGVIPSVSGLVHLVSMLHLNDLGALEWQTLSLRVACYGYGRNSVFLAKLSL